MLTRVGRVEVWRILESVEPFDTAENLFPGISSEDAAWIAATVPGQVDPETGMVVLPIQGFLLVTPDHVILVDACVGNDKTVPFRQTWHQRASPRFLAGLTAAGVTPADVDYVFCTHPHPDHIGWNTQLLDGRWIPTFPNARHILPASEVEAFPPEGEFLCTESILPVIEAGQADLVEPDHRLGDHVALIPTPGHSPGHVAVEIRDGDAVAVITGDVMHSSIQCTRPDWNIVFDRDKEMAAATRTRFVEDMAESGARVLGSHFVLPSMGRIRSRGDGFVWDEDQGLSAAPIRALHLAQAAGGAFEFERALAFDIEHVG
jgi:glyoxylase-like metal-dependent hydrolase (beta-lactamase superfamily II)